MTDAQLENKLLDFSEALSALKIGVKVRRIGWNGKGMFLVLFDNWQGRTLLPANLPEDWSGECAPFIGMYTADKKLVPWLASQTDLLASDWEAVQ